MSDEWEAAAVRLLLNAVEDRELIEYSLKQSIYSQALFHSEQACEKASKACLFVQHYMPKEEHRFVEDVRMLVIPNAKKMKGQFDELIAIIVKLESLYIQTRYGVSIKGKINYTDYHSQEQDVLRLCNSAMKYLDLCFDFVEGKMGRQITSNGERPRQVLFRRV